MPPFPVTAKMTRGRVYADKLHIRVGTIRSGYTRLPPIMGLNPFLVQDPIAIMYSINMVKDFF